MKSIDCANAELLKRFAFDSVAKQIIVKTGKVELGQHLHSAFQKIVADTLNIDKMHVSVAAVCTSFSPDDGLTVGSLSIQVTGASLHLAARTLSKVMIQEAAQILDTDDENISLDPAGLEFVAPSRRCSIFDLPVVKSRVINVHKEGTHLDCASTVTESILGERLYIQDLVLPGMIYARALRGRDFDISKAKNVSLVKKGGFSALVANTEVALEHAWSQFEHQTIARDKSCDGPVTDWIRERRSLTQMYGKSVPINASVSMRATRPFLLHASIAPSCGIACFKQGVLEIWTHSQGVFQLREAVAKHIGLMITDVIVRHIPSAGCYGHNAADDAAMDAVLVSLQNEGSPVRVVWTRQDEFQHAPAGAAMHVQIEAQMAEDNSIMNWQQTIWSCPHGQRPGAAGHTNLLAAIEEDSQNRATEISDLPESIGGGATRNAMPPYTIGTIGITSHIVQDLPVRTSAIRGLGTQMNVVGIESTMNKLAESCAADPLEFRLMHLQDPRGRDVLHGLKSLLNIDAPKCLRETEAIGIAYSRYKEKAAYAAVAARVHLGETVELLDVWAVVDAGFVIDRCGTLNQIEGGIIQAASWTLCEGVLLRDGVIDASGWENYPIIGWSDVPAVHTNLVAEHRDVPSLGVGECMVGPVSAAIVNAVSTAAGCSMTDLPITREKFLQSAAAGE